MLAYLIPFSMLLFYIHNLPQEVILVAPGPQQSVFERGNVVATLAVARLRLPHPPQKIHTTRPHRNNMLPIRMKSTGIERTIHIQGTETFSRTRIPHLERLVPGSRHDIVSCRADRTPCHLHPMPAQGAALLPRTRIPHLERLVIG